jgi:hypothetical protein
LFFIGIIYILIFIGFTFCIGNDKGTINFEKDQSNVESEYVEGEWINISPAPEIIIDANYDYANMSPMLVIRVTNNRNYSLNITEIKIDDMFLPTFRLPRNSTYRFMIFDTNSLPKCPNHCHRMTVSIENEGASTIYNFGYLGEVRFGIETNGGTSI